MKQFFKDSKDQYSSTRLGFIIWTVGPFIVWVVHSFVHPGQSVITGEVVMVILGFVSGKVFQKQTEEKSTNVNTTDDIGT